MSLRFGIEEKRWTTVRTEEDEAFEQMEHAQGWRKRQIANALDKKAENARELGLTYEDDILCYRNDVLEEVALEFDKMKVFGDTAASFALFVRQMKRL